MADPASLAMASIGSSAAGGITGAIGSIFGGEAKSEMYTYQAGIAAMNAKIAKQNADYETSLGEVQAQQLGMKTRAQIGETRAIQGASGLDLNSGSNLEVRVSEAELGVQDQAMIRSNAARRAYGQEIIAAQETAQSNLDMMAASNAKTEGFIGAASSILGAGGSVSSKWLQAGQMGVPGF
ncbi:MAG TPA: hypothetical protein VGA05_08280 [Candidatus Bathyarchaeia archaeon]